MNERASGGADGAGEPLLSGILHQVGRHPGFAWLDGGPGGTSWLGIWPDLEIESDDVHDLERVEAAWQRDRTALWIGWLTYDMGVDVLRGRPVVPHDLPGLMFRRYTTWAETTDAGTRVHGPRADALRSALASTGLAPRRWSFGELRAQVDPAEYRRRVASAVERIRAGETYQVNLSQRFTAPWSPAPGDDDLPGAVARAYASLRARAPAEMGALVEVRPGSWILSNSPETLLDVAEHEGVRVARSWPIKGTRPRADHEAEDQALASELLASEKDRAEHVMIVDLVRNDLGRVCRAGSVRADATELVSLPTVHHLVTEVRGEVRADIDLMDLFAAMWPGGSITGAPKRRTTAIIEELEDAPRGIYCGAMVVLHPRGLRASIPIRTATVDHRGLSMRSGGGVVVDSEAEAERRETIDKARAFTAPV